MNVVTVNEKKPEGLAGMAAWRLPTGALVEFVYDDKRRIAIRAYDGRLVALDDGISWASDYRFRPTDRILSPGETVTLTVKG